MNPERGIPLEGGTDFEFPDSQDSESQTAEAAEKLEVLPEFVKKEKDELPVSRRPRPSRLKMAMRGITIGLALALLTSELASAQKLDPAEKTRIETQMQELQAQLDVDNKIKKAEKQGQRMKEMNDWIKPFEVAGLRIGEVKSMLRMPNEQVGVYFEQDKKPERHIGDIYAKGGLKISRLQLVQEVSDMLQAVGIDTKYDLSPDIKSDRSFSLEVDTEALLILQEWGGGVLGDAIDFGSPKENLGLNKDGKTKNVSIFAGGRDDQGRQMLIVRGEDKDGSKFTGKIVKGEILEIKSY